MPSSPEQPPKENERARLAAVLAFLKGATLQKLWLPSAAVAVLQLRVPGRTLLLVVDGKRGIALEAAERRAAPDLALPAQAPLRNALAGARLDAIELSTLAGEGRLPVLALCFSTPRGPRTLVAEPGTRPLLALLAPAAAGATAAERIVWLSMERTAAAAPESRRPGGPYPARTAVPLEAAAIEAAPAQALTAEAMLAHDEKAALQARRTALLKSLQARQKKVARTLAAIETDLARARAADEGRKKAELLLPHQGRIPRGAREAQVPDWSQADEQGRPATVTIALDPALGAAGSAARWLKRAHRYAAAIPRIEMRRSEIARALEGLAEVRQRAEAAKDRGSLRAAEEDARARGALAESLSFPSAPGRSRNSKQAARPPFREFRSSSGARLLVGRNAKSNDELTLRWARGNDLWLHARGLQGSHVVVPEPGDAPDPRTLAEAALLAAHFSGARGADAAEVAWTRKKHVRKPKGAAPGAVTYSQEKTIRVRLEEDRLRALLASEVTS